MTRTEIVTTVERGTTIFCYTGGLIERRDSDLDSGISRLHRTLTEFGAQPPQQLCDLVIERLMDGRHSHDAAIVVVRLHPQNPPRPDEAGPVIVPDGAPVPTADN